MTSKPGRQTTIHDITLIESVGQWDTKSGGVLKVNLTLPQAALSTFLDYENPAFDEVNENIRGLRVYTISRIPKGRIGGMEWHQIRTEYVRVLSGRVIMECMDMDGDEHRFVLDDTCALIIPPKILHTYKTLENDTSLQVIANTLYMPDDPETHDTFHADTFMSSRSER